MHAFLVSIRDRDHRMNPGVVAGECGPKISLHRIDNCFLIFTGFRAPYDCLLDRFVSLLLAANFKSTFKNN